MEEFEEGWPSLFYFALVQYFRWTKEKSLKLRSAEFLRNSYYYMKPLIPRWLQIQLRKRVILLKRLMHSEVWPINEKVSGPPPKWFGWPGEKKFALVLTHDVDTARGQARCQKIAELEQRLGFKSSFNFVPEGYTTSAETRNYLTRNGFEVGVHGLYHDGNLYRSRKKFLEKAQKINFYLKEWEAVGFRSPSMHHNLDWIHDLNIEYDASTFDTDPFEPQPDGMGVIFPFFVKNHSNQKGYVELPYTLAQDFTLFILMGERNTEIWERKLDWIVEKGGMALLITHPDYMNCTGGKCRIEEYPIDIYEEFLNYIMRRYEGQYWHLLPREMARFWKTHVVNPQPPAARK